MAPSSSRHAEALWNDTRQPTAALAANLCCRLLVAPLDVATRGVYLLLDRQLYDWWPDHAIPLTELYDSGLAPCWRLLYASQGDAQRIRRLESALDALYVQLAIYSVWGRDDASALPLPNDLREIHSGTLADVLEVTAELLPPDQTPTLETWLYQATKGQLGWAELQQRAAEDFGSAAGWT